MKNPNLVLATKGAFGAKLKKPLLALASMLICISLFAAAEPTANAEDFEIRTIDGSQIGARKSAVADSLYHLGLYSGLPQIANVIIEAKSGSTKQELTATMASAGLKISDSEILVSTDVYNSENAYLTSELFTCEFTNATIRKSHNGSDYDHLVCYSRPAQTGSTLLKSMTPERYDRAPSDVFDTLAKIAPVKKAEQRLGVSIGPIICSPSICAIAHGAGEELHKLDKKLSQELYNHLVYTVHARANISTDEQFLLLGVESIACSQKLDDKAWKDTTCQAKWAPASTSSERARALSQSLMVNPDVELGHKDSDDQSEKNSSAE
jgi:hypothetical protein